MRLRPACIALALALLCAASAAVAAPPQDGFDPATMMRVSEVRPGMLGIGKSVFLGTEIEEFHVRLLDVIPKARVGTDLILCRILDGPPIEQRAGLIAGMSGSPVYVNGKLVGAIGYGFSFAKEAVGAITPIENMLRAFEPGAEPEAELPRACTIELPDPLQIDGRTIERIAVQRGFAPPQGFEPSGTLTLQPLGAVAMAAGFDGRGLERLREVLEPLGLTVMQGPGGSGDFGTGDMLQPGAVMAATLMSGDLEVAGVGTLTYRSGNRVLGFGHPFMTFTDPTLDIGLAPGRVHGILASLLSSSKLSSAGRVVGRVTRDRTWAIGGEVGSLPDMVPFSLQINVGARSRSFQMKIVRGRMITSGLAASAVMTATDQMLGYAGEGTAQIEVNLVPRGRPPIQRRDLVYSRDIAAALTAHAAQPLATFTDTPFGSMEFERLEMRVSLRPVHGAAVIERIYTTASKVKAGEDLEVNVELRPFGREKITRTVMLHIPDEMPTGRARVGVSGGSDAERVRSALNLARVVPTSLDQLVQQYESREAAGQLVVQVALPTRGVSLPDESLPSLPSSVGAVLSATRSSAIRPVSDGIKQTEDMEWVIQGRQVITVAIEGRPGAPKAGPPPPGPPSEAGPPEDEGPEEEEPNGESVHPMDETIPLQRPFAVPPRGNASPPDAEKRPAKKPEAPEPLIRQPDRWIQDTRADLEKGELHGLALDSDGTLSLAPADGPTWELPAQGVWSLAATDGAAYAGTGNAGVIYSLSDDGTSAPFFETGQAIVHSLALDPQGNLYAGTSPRGLIYKIAPDGQGAVFFDTGQVYVWALVFDAEGRLLAGTGADGRLFRINSAGDGEEIVALQSPHLLSLAPGAGGEVYAGTGNNGVIYRIAADGGAQVLFDLPGGQIHGLALGDNGDLYAAVTPKGAICRITPAGAVEMVFDSGDRLIFALVRGGGVLHTATGAKGLVFRVRSDKDASLLLKPETGQALALALSPGGDLYVGGANPPLVRRLGARHRSSGTFESEVLDARVSARWGTLTWYAHRPEGTRVALQTRSGNSPDPKDSWSPWSAPTDTSGGLIASPPARYLQYRVTLGSDEANPNPSVSHIEINYLPKNRKPAVRLAAPEPGQWWAKRQKIEWKGDDPDKDTLLYTVHYSVDASIHWEPLKKDTKDTSYEWDTTQIEDGLYSLKVTATDRLTSPADPESGDAEGMVGVDNTPPEALILRHSIAVAADRRVALRGRAWDETSSVRGVDYRVDGKEWLTATPTDGLFDGRSVSFSIATDPLSPGTHTIEVRAFDEASNLGSDKVKITVERPSPPPTTPPPPEEEAPREEPPAPESEP